MGNRAVIKQSGSSVGVYLHWNGGAESVTAFLKYCELRGFRGFDDPYGIARFCQVVGNYFGGSLSIGIEGDVKETEEYAKWIDNGVYVVSGWEIRKHIGGSRIERLYDLDEMIRDIDMSQPVSERLGDYLDADNVATDEVKMGDVVFVMQYETSSPTKFKVIGYGDNRIVNGRDVSGLPMIARCLNEDGTVMRNNINNYITTDTVRVIRKGQGGR